MASPVIQFKRGLFSSLPGLRSGEPGFTTDKYDLYVGIDSTTNGNKFFGSHRYWTKETTTAGSGVNLVEGTDNGTNAVTLKAPANIASDVTYTFPGAAVDQGYLRTNSSGVLSWESGINATGVSTISFLQATTANVSAAATVGTDLSVNRNLTVSGGIAGNINASGVSTVSHLQSTTVNVSSAATVGTNLSVNRDLTVSGGITGRINSVGVSTAAFLQATTVNVSAAATIPTLTGTTATFTNITANGSFTGNINAAGVSTVSALQATTVNSSGIVTASSLRAADLRTTGGALIPLVGIQSAAAATGIVTAFKFVGTGLDGFTVANNVATISYSGVAATTYTTSQTVIATEGQTSFTFNAGYTEGFIDAYLNGIRLITGNDYTANNGATILLTSSATAGDELEMVAWKSLGDVVNVNTLRTAGSVNVSGVVTARSFDGALNFTGVSTAGQVLVTTVNASGIVTASSFSGSGSGLSAGTVPISALDIDGGTAATEVTSDDLFIVDDSANGANKKVTAQILSNYILGGSGGATFPAINVTGIGTVSQLKSTTATVGAGLTVTGATDLNGGLDVSGGETVLSSATVSDLTSGRVVLAGTSGALEDSANLTFGANGLRVTGSTNISGIVTSSAGFSGNINATGVSTIGFLTATTINSSGVVTAFSFRPTSSYYQSASGTNSFYVFDGTGNVAFQGTIGASQLNSASGNKVIGLLANDAAFERHVTATGIVTASSFSGPVTGNVTGNITGNVTGNLNSTGVSTVSFLQATTINASGIVTASSFSGPVTGNVTGNVIGNINSTGVSTVSQLQATTVNVSAAATIPTLSGTTATFTNITANGGFTGNLNSSGVSTATFLRTTNLNASGIVTGGTLSGSLANTLTLGTSGTGISGSATFNNSAGVTFTVTSNATSSNTSSTIVSRDASNNFSAGTITAALTGNVTGNINSTGISTVAFLQATTVNATGIVTALSFSGSGSGLSVGTVPASAIDIDGATAATGLTSDDLFLIDDGAGGTNKKLTAQQLSNYVLGGSGGATFPAINVTGIATATFLKATTATVGAGLTVTGAITGTGGASITGGETTLSSATVSDLTSGRVVLAGTSGALEDSSNLTFGANGLRVTGGSNVSAASTFGSNLSVGGNVIVSGDLTVNGTTTQINTVSMTVEDTLIELQIVDGSAPGSDTNKDIGIVMNYFDSSAKKAAFYWDDSASRMVAASQVSETTGVLTASTFAGLEIGSLWLNDCAGQQQVISCSGTTRSLNDITIDGGSF